MKEGGGFPPVLIPIYAASEPRPVTAPETGVASQCVYHWSAGYYGQKKLFCGLLNLITLPRYAISKITL